VKLTDDLRKETEERNRMIRDGVYALNADPTEVWVAPTMKDSVPYLNFAPLQNAVARLRAASARNDEAWKHADSAGIRFTAETKKSLNRIFREFEHELTVQGGLPGRPWYIHAVYAPGQYTGYGVKTLPGIREAIELRNWKQAEEQIVVAARVLDQAAAAIQKTTSLIR